MLRLHGGDQEGALLLWERLGRGLLSDAEAEPIGPTVELLSGQLRLRLALP